MTDKTIKLSATGRAMLTEAATREDRLVPPPKLPAAAARQVVRSLISNGLIEEVAAVGNEPEVVWRTGADDMPLVMRATDAGVAAVTEGTASPVAEQLISDNDTDTAIPSRRLGLRHAAEAVLAAWQALDGQAPNALLAPMQALRAALQPAAARTVRPIGQPREGTKQMQVLAMLRRPEGATVAQIAEAMAWQPHTVRGFFVGVQKRLGLTVSGEKVPATEPGAKAQTIYRIIEAG